MDALLNYDTSWLNPALKFVIVGLYIVVAVVFIRGRRAFAGDLHGTLTVLFWMASVGALAAFLRYFGHGLQFGFTTAYSLKWFESIGYVVQAILLAVAGWSFVRGVVPDVRK